MPSLSQFGWGAAIAAAAIVAVPALAQAEEARCPSMPAASLAPPPASIPGTDAHVYKTVGDRQLRLYVRQPASGKPGSKHPAMVFFAGSGWMTNNPAFLDPTAQHFSERGAVTVLLDLRAYCLDGVNIVDQVKDARAAMSWVRAHAKQLDIAPDKIVAVGGSAGGHLALSTAMFDDLDEQGGKRPTSPRPNLLMLFFPCVDETTEIELKYSAKAIQTFGPAMSPSMHIAKGLPPMLIAQGTADPLYAENKDYCAKVAAAGNDCRFVEYKDAPHGFSVPGSKWYDASLDETDRFLTQHGYLPRR
jgi:acetyl esterase/lipase